MFNLVHNVDFVIAGICVILVIIFSVGKKYSQVSKSNRMFYLMIFTSLIACVVDVFMNVAETYTNVFSYTVSGFMRAIFNILTGVLIYFTYRYVGTYSSQEENEKGGFLQTLATIVIIAYIISGFLNIFWGFMSYFDENGNFCMGPLYLINYFVPGFLLVLILIRTFTSKKYFTKAQFFSILSLTVLVSGGILMEFLVGTKVLFIFFSVSLALLVIQLSLETPDYKKMNETMNALQKSTEDLEVANKIAEEAKAQAISANLAKSDFLARMSHEIRTPMNAIVGMNELILKEEKDPQIKEYSKDISRAAESLLELINEILDFSKIESGKMEIINQPYDFKELLANLYAMFIIKTRDKGLDLEFDIDSDIPLMLIGDSLRIKQILINLLSNAIKYTDTGKVTFVVKKIFTVGNSVSVSFLVKDTGRGIKKEDIGKLFEAFERIDEKANRSIEGTGLGVNIVTKLLKMMGSELKVNSVYGNGSEFSFELLQECEDINITVGDFREKSVKDNMPKDIIALHAPDAKILSVDDNALNLKVFTALLKKTNMNITICQSGKEALIYTSKEKFDLIFMDHMMPEMDGVEALRNIRVQENGKNKDTKVIALTANAVKGAYDEYLGYGFDDVCFKPTTQKDLYEKLKKHLPENLIKE